MRVNKFKNFKNFINLHKWIPNFITKTSTHLLTSFYLKPLVFNISNINPYCFFHFVILESVWGKAFKPQFGNFWFSTFSKCINVPVLNPLSAWPLLTTTASSAPSNSSSSTYVYAQLVPTFIPMVWLIPPSSSISICWIWLYLFEI